MAIESVIPPFQGTIIPGKDTPAQGGQSWRTYERDFAALLKNLLNALPIIGTATLVAGTVTVAITAVAPAVTGYTAQATHATFTGTVGELRVAINVGNIVITSSSNMDTSQVWYAVFPPSATPVPFQPYK